MPLPTDVVVIFLSLLAPNVQFRGCATIAFSEWYVL